MLRGLAIFGMPLVNFSVDLPWSYLFETHWTGVVDRAAVFLVRVFADGKFFSLFSFLFGLGFYLQMTRLEVVVPHPTLLYARRLLVLLGIGATALALKIAGDILVVYAIFGFCLMPFRKASSRTVLLAAVVFLFCAPLLRVPAVRRSLDYKPAPVAAERVHEREFRLYSTGSFLEVVAYRTRKIAALVLSPPKLFGRFLRKADVLGLMLLGLEVGRRGYLADMARWGPMLGRAMWWFLGFGILTTLMSFVAPRSWLEWGHLATISLSGFYATALVGLVQRPAWRARLGPLASVGRMALTNYLLQGVAYALLALPVGFGLYGRVGPAAGVGVALLVFAAQAAGSVWWIQHFRFGPVEWLWRTLTYGRWQPMRRQAALA
jgi:uncharacterized protein